MKRPYKVQVVGIGVPSFVEVDMMPDGVTPEQCPASQSIIDALEQTKFDVQPGMVYLMDYEPIDAAKNSVGPTKRVFVSVGDTHLHSVAATSEHEAHWKTVLHAVEVFNKKPKEEQEAIVKAIELEVNATNEVKVANTEPPMPTTAPEPGPKTEPAPEPAPAIAPETVPEPTPEAGLKP